MIEAVSYGRLPVGALSVNTYSVDGFLVYRSEGWFVAILIICWMNGRIIGLFCCIVCSLVGRMSMVGQ